MSTSLKLENIQVQREGDTIVKGVSLELPAGAVHVIMGPNGSGKSSLANAVMGHPKYVLSEGTVTLNGEDITDIPVYEKARKGLFLSMQYPAEIAGVSVSSFIRAAVNAKSDKPVNVMEFQKHLKETMDILGIDHKFARRGLNEGFSGGEKKRMEILQLMMLEPKYAMLDETDSGLDVDALKIVSKGIAAVHKKGMGILLITHYARMLKYIDVDVVYIMNDGKIIKTGSKDLADEIENNGYTEIINE